MKIFEFGINWHVGVSFLFRLIYGDQNFRYQPHPKKSLCFYNEILCVSLSPTSLQSCISYFRVLESLLNCIRVQHDVDGKTLNNMLFNHVRQVFWRLEI